MNSGRLPGGDISEGCSSKARPDLAGVDLFTLSRRMGTSLAMIDQTYGHLAPDADERERVLLDTYDAATTAAGGEAR